MYEKSLENIVENHTVQLSFMVGAISEMKAYLKEIASTQADLKVIMERQIAHEEANSTEHKHIHERINKIEAECKEIREDHGNKCDLVFPKVEKGVVAYNIMKWAGGIVGGLFLAAVVAKILKGTP